MSKFFKPVTKLLLPNNYYINKNVIITGGGSGLGLNISKTFYNLGANVLILGRNNDKLLNAKSEIFNSDKKNKINTFSLDIKDIDNVKKFYSEIDFVPDILINNAAANFMCPSLKLTPNGYKSIIDTVLYGSLNMTLEFGKICKKNIKGGIIGSISATYADTGCKGVLPSAMAKAGINSMVKTLAPEWGKYGIRTFGVAPGPIYTEGAFSRLDPTGEGEKFLKNNNPTKRFGEKEELSNLITYLCSDYASWINGEIIRIDGGELNENSGMFNRLVK
tara:strand:+ start:632 stop:1459 length:828 start_codon:yes stop_codon:yes gene_type:complete